MVCISENLYICMDLAPGGELLSLISRKTSENQARGISETACDFSTCRFYFAEIVEALEYLHGLNIIHRGRNIVHILIQIHHTIINIAIKSYISAGKTF